jgi:membrane fusion protein (multidrug efflux system)
MVALVALGAWLRATAPEPEQVEADAARGIAVRTEPAALVPLQPRIQISGMVEARRRVDLFAEQSGRVLETGAERLDRVEEGQLLLRLDPLAAEVEVARAEAALAQAKSELDLARANLERLRSLASSRVSSEKDLDQAANDERVALATWRAADASLRDARDRLEKKTITAPFAGVLREFPVEVGEYVAPGERVAELLELSRVRIEIGLRDREAVAVSAGAVARVEAEARPGERFEGTVTRVAGAADPKTRKFAVQVELANPEERLLPGMIAKVELDLGQGREALLVPREAVLDEFGLAFVYVVEPGGPDGAVARRRRIEAKPVPFQPGDMEVTAGLSDGERIAVTQLRQLADGARVEPRTALARRAGPAAESEP